MGPVASQITSLTIVYSTVYSGADQRKHQSSASLDFVRGIHQSPVNSPQKGPVTRKMFPYDDVLKIIPSLNYHSKYCEISKDLICHLERYHLVNKMLCKVIDCKGNFEKTCLILVITALADGLALLVARTTAITVMTNFGSRLYIWYLQVSVVFAGSIWQIIWW